MAVRVDISQLAHEVDEIHESYPAWTRDNAFVHWFLQAFLVADRDLAARAVTGVSHDKGIDGVYVDDDVGKVFLVQGKFHEGTAAPQEPRSEIVAFAGWARRLAAPERDFHAALVGIDPAVGAKLQDARKRIRNRSFPLQLYYVTTGRCSAPLKSEVEAEVAQANWRASISALDRADVLNLLTDYLGGAAPPVPYLDLPIDTRGVVGSDGVIQRFDPASRIESWILTMSGKNVAELYREAGDRLFARNIRGFLGNTAINEGMEQTLKAQPTRFWYFNNGVTIVCDAARKTAERGQAILRVTNPQVINGQQTTRVLHRRWHPDAGVLVRVISVPRDAKTDQGKFEALVSNIVAATNWQNAILSSDLRSNDARQVAMERDFAKLSYHYLRKRQTKREARRLMGNQYGFRIKKEELAQIVAACDSDPVLVRGGKEGLFKVPHYDRIFDGRPVREYLSMYWLGRVVKYHSKGFPERAYPKWHVLHFLWKHVAPLVRNRAAADYF
ncbi:MAG: AIPR family protein, partial [Myxococcota bacterium]|nr:AIPR family protein [Myxococcota bacterium]